MIAGLVRTVQRLTIACGLSNRAEPDPAFQRKLTRDREEPISNDKKKFPVQETGQPALRLGQPDQSTFSVSTANTSKFITSQKQKELVFAKEAYPSYNMSTSEIDNEEEAYLDNQDNLCDPVRDIDRLHKHRRKRLPGFLPRRGMLFA